MIICFIELLQFQYQGLSTQGKDFADNSNITCRYGVVTKTVTQTKVSARTSVILIVFSSLCNSSCMLTHTGT